jgi:pimeloyl-ACP methyl ester carboxylesterase
MPTLTIRSQPLFYTRPSAAPDPNRPALLLLHGAGGNHLVWPKGLRQLPDTAVYTLDLPGHGRSPGPGCNTIEGYADHVAAFLASLHLESVILGGHSMGAAIALALAARRQTAVRGLVLIGAGARLRVAPAILTGLQTDFAATVDLLNSLFWSASPQPIMVRRTRDVLLATGPDVLHGDFVACDGFDLRETLPDIPHPALIVTGAADQLTPPKHGQFLADHLPAGQLHIVPEMGHMVMVEAETAVATAVGEFVARPEFSASEQRLEIRD